MTSRKLTSGFDFWSCGHLRKAVTHRSTKSVQRFVSNLELFDVFLEIQDGGAPSWIFKLGKFGTFPHVHSVVLELHPKFGSNNML